MNKPFCYDYFSLKQEEPEDWYKNFFWPVSREMTTQITEDFKKFHCDLINRLGNTFEGDCLVIAYHISGKFTEVVNHYISLNRLEAAGYFVVPSKKLQLIPLLQKKNEPIEFSYGNLLDVNYSIKDLIRNDFNSFKFNFKRGHYSFHRQFLSKNSTIASAGIMNHEYVNGLNKWIKIISAEHLLDSNFHNYSSLPKGSVGILEGISDEFISFTLDYSSEKFQLELPENVIDGLRKFAKGYLLKAACAYSNLLKNISAIKISSFLSSTGGNTYTRALSLAISKCGGKGIGFPHGFFMCHHSGSRPSFHEFSTIDQFVTYTQRSIPLFKRNIEANPMPRGHRISFVSDNTEYFKNLHRYWIDRPRADKIRTVMVLELSMIPEWAGYYAADAMVNYHFYYSICKTLSKNGFKVIFKRRPKDPSWEGFNIFEKIPDVKVVYEHFESPGIIDQADAVILQYGCSSTLNWSMCTNKTVIYADAGWEPWFPDVYQLMAKRCRILHCSYNNRNRAYFDEKELIYLLEAKPESPDYGYVEKYLYP